MSSPKKHDNDVVQNTINEIRRAGLRYPAFHLLWCFIEQAKKPQVAAAYAKQRMDAGELYLMVSDWVYIVECLQDNSTLPEPPYREKDIIERDHGRCCLTGLKGTFWDPLVVRPSLPVPTGWRTKLDNGEEDRITPMLRAFFGRTYADWWLQWARGPEANRMNPLYPTGCHWLVRKSAAKAFARGIICLERWPKRSGIEYLVYYDQHSVTEDNIEHKGNSVILGGEQFERVDWRFVDTQARLSESMRFIEIARDLAPEILREGGMSDTSAHEVDDQPLQPFREEPCRQPFVVIKLLISALLAIWLMLPVGFRSFVYGIAKKIGNSWEDSQSLPFGLHLQVKTLKELVDDYANQFNALELVRRHTTIPVARPLDLVPGPGFYKPEPLLGSPVSFTLMTSLPGYKLPLCTPFMSERHLQEIKVQLRDYISQLRAVPKTVNPEMAICNTLGGALRDLRRRESRVGPFPDEEAFSQILPFPDDPSRRGHEIVFTHGNLSPTNILVDRCVRADGTKAWKVTGIVNWLAAGYYPEYWEYTKAVYSEERFPRYSGLIQDIFSGFGDYTPELRLKRMSWKVMDEEDEVRYKEAVKESKCGTHRSKRSTWSLSKFQRSRNRPGNKGLGTNDLSWAPTETVARNAG